MARMTALSLGPQTPAAEIVLGSGLSSTLSTVRRNDSWLVSPARARSTASMTTALAPSGTGVQSDGNVVSSLSSRKIMPMLLIRDVNWREPMKDCSWPKTAARCGDFRVRPSGPEAGYLLRLEIAILFIASHAHAMGVNPQFPSNPNPKKSTTPSAP